MFSVESDCELDVKRIKRVRYLFSKVKHCNMLTSLPTKYEYENKIDVKSLLFWGM